MLWTSFDTGNDYDIQFIPNWQDIITCPLTPLLLTLRSEELQGPLTPPCQSLNAFPSITLDVIWATTEWTERLAQKYVWFYNLPDKTYWQKIEQSYFSSMYLFTKFISGHMKIEQLLHVTACPVHDKLWFCWLVSPEVISNTMGNWETGKLSDCTHGLASRALPLWQFTVIQ